MANTGEIQDLTVSWEGYAGSSVEAFIKKEFTSALKGEVGVEISGYVSEGGILPVSNVYTYQDSPITPIVVIEDRALGGSTKLYFPIYKAYYSFEPYTEKLEYFVFEYRSGYEVETGYYYVDTVDNLPSWVAKQNAAKLPVATTTANGLMSSADKTALGNKVDKVEGKGLSTNDFTVIELSDYTSSDDELPTDDNLIYTYHGQVVEKRICKLDGDNDAILFITNRDLSDLEMDDLVVLAYIRSGGSDYNYTYDNTYYTNNSNCPTWVKAGCGITYANTENGGLMSPDMYDDLLASQKKQIVRTIDGSTSTSATLNIGYDYNVTGSLNTFNFVLPDSPADGEINILCTTGATPDISFSSAANIYLNSVFNIKANSRYEINIRAFQGNYYMTLTKMTAYNNNIFCKLTLSNGGTVGIEGSGELTRAMITNNIEDKTTITKAELNENCTSIGDNVFSGCTGLTNITIPDTVTRIGDSAFSGCSILTSITIPDSVTSIGYATFYGCALTSITIPDSVTSIGGSAFQNCTWLQSTIIPDSVTSIGDSAFRNCSGLNSITIGSGVTSIGGNAFDNCTILTSITIPDSVTSIGSSAFKSCTGLTSVTIGSGVTSIGYAAFQKCSGLTSIVSNATTAPTISNWTFNLVKTGGTLTVQSGASGYDVWMGTTSFYLGFYNWTMKEQTYLCKLTLNDGTEVEIEGSGELTQTMITDKVEDKTTIINARLGKQCTSIGENTFYGCSGLTDVTIPDSVTSIGTQGFSGCSGLTDVTIPDSVTSIGERIFQSCSGLTDVTIGNGITSISFDTFSNCSGLTSITIPDSVTNIGPGAFRSCSGLTSITIPDSVTSIGSQAFQRCSSLTSIVSNAMTAPTIQSYTFQNVKTGGTLTVPVGSTGYDVWMGTGNYYLGKYNWTKVEQ